VDETEARTYGVELANLSTFSVVSQSTINDFDDLEVHEGWDIKRRDLVLHYAYALRRGEVFSLRTRAEGAAHAEEL
jgi:hypothetical protein